MKYRKRPVVIEAVQFDGTPGGANAVLNAFDIPDAKFRPGGHSEPWTPADLGWGTLLIPTLEEPHTASPGDWIIRGIKGEFYPCKPDIFALTYEPAGEER